MTLENTKYLRDLRYQIIESFDIDELETLAFDLGVPWEEISGKTKSTKAQNFIMFQARRGNLKDLVMLLEEARPSIEWPTVPEASRQIQDEQQLGLSEFHQPLLRAAFDLQSRLFNIVEGHFLKIYYREQDFKQYAVANTCYAIGEYLGWVELLHRSGQLRMSLSSSKFENLIYDISRAFMSDSIQFPLMLFKGEQRAIGEIMLNPMRGEKGIIGYATFVKQLNDPDFSKWFTRLEKDIEQLATEKFDYDERLIFLQNSLTDLINYLDPDFIYYAEKYRQKLSKKQI